MLLRTPRTSRPGASHQTPAEERYYTECPRYEESVRRVCGKSVILFRSDLAENLVRGLMELENLYRDARETAQHVGRNVADLEARLGAAIVVIHLQLISKIDELEELAQTGTPITDVKRLAENVAPLVSTLYALESRSSIATTGDLNEEERNKLRFYRSARYINLARAVQLRREAQAAKRRLADSETDEHDARRDDSQKRLQDALALKQRAQARLKEIHDACHALAEEGDASKELALDALLQQVAALL